MPKTSFDRLSIAEVRKCVEHLDWSRLHRHLERQVWSENNVDQIAQTLLECSSLVLRYPHPELQKQRRSFLEHLITYISDKGGGAAADQLRVTVDKIRTAEAGYHSLLELLADTEQSEWTIDQTVAAIISLGAHQVAAALEAMASFAKNAEILEPEAYALRDGEGGIYPADDVVAMVDSTTTAAIQMYAARAGWISRSGAVVLPPLPPIDRHHREYAREIQQLAEAWSFWRTMEERCRFENGYFQHLVTRQERSLREETTIRYKPSPEAMAWEGIAIASHERLNTEIHSIFHELAFRTDARAKTSGLTGRAPLYPAAIISLSEAESARALDFILSTSVGIDQTQYLGLTLAEWLRGYSALALMADEASKHTAENPDVLTWTIQHADLRDRLVWLGLRRERAEQFIDQLTFRQTSIDLVDEPLIRASDGSFLVFGASLVGAVPARIILSKLGRSRVSLGGRGQRFEREVRRWFSQWGLRAYAFKVRRNGADYEYDAVVPWGDYVFVFECKSRGPTAPGPVQRRHTRSALYASLTQASRLAEALRQEPDILQERLGVGAADRTIVPCVLNALPMAFPGGVNGTFCTDLPSLGLFFEVGSLDLSVTHVIPGRGSIKQCVARQPLWSGSTPSPGDLLHFLDNAPLQAVVLEQLEEHSSRVRIGTNCYAETVQMIRPPESIERTVQVLGGDVSAIRENIKSVSEALAGLRTNERP